jgi:hypothetical protein
MKKIIESKAKRQEDELKRREEIEAKSKEVEENKKRLAEERKREEYEKQKRILEEKRNELMQSKIMNVNNTTATNILGSAIKPKFADLKHHAPVKHIDDKFKPVVLLNKVSILFCTGSSD